MDIQKLLKRYGSQSAMADAFGVTKGAVSQWVKAGKIPEARRWQYEAGKVARPR
jgi:DNA-binding transcriptional regulator YdaS (Cro superfamily)